VVTPLIGVRMEPEARILPLDGTARRCGSRYTHRRAEGTVALELPAGWRAERQRRAFIWHPPATPSQFNSQLLPPHTGSGIRNPGCGALGRTFLPHGWQSVGYTGLRPYNQYKPALLKTRKVDVKLSPGLRIGYVMGTGDLFQRQSKHGSQPHLITASEITRATFPRGT